jgi:hypothetical protein
MAPDWYEFTMPTPPRPVSVTASAVLVTICVVLSLVSWLLHTSFMNQMDVLLRRPHDGTGIRMQGLLAALWVAEPAKLLIGGAALWLWWAVLHRNNAARVTAVVVTAVCALAYAAAAFIDGLRVVIVFFLASLASAANALSGKEGLPGGGGRGLGLAATALDVLLLVLAATCATLLSTRPWREYVARANRSGDVLTAYAG